MSRVSKASTSAAFASKREFPSSGEKSLEHAGDQEEKRFLMRNERRLARGLAGFTIELASYDAPPDNCEDRHGYLRTFSLRLNTQSA